MRIRLYWNVTRTLSGILCGIFLGLAASVSLAGTSAHLCFSALHGSGDAVYHDNGKLLTDSAGRTGAVWYHSNGNIFAHAALTSGVALYHSNGRILTDSAGQAGAVWYWSNGQVFSRSTGTPGAIWYHPDGRIMTRNGPDLNETELYQLACEIGLD